MKKVNYEYTACYLKDCVRATHDTIASRKEKIESHINRAVENGGNVVVFLHPNKATLKVHIRENNMVYIVAYDTDGDFLSATKPFLVTGMCIYDLYGEAENEEWEVEHLSSVLVG